MSEMQRNRPMHAGNPSLMTGLVADRRPMRVGVRIALVLAVMVLAIVGFAAHLIPMPLLASLLLVACTVSWILWRRSHMVPRIAVSGLSEAIHEDPRISRMADSLKASERRYAELVQLSLGMIYEHDPDGILGMVNPAFARALGYPESELVGRNLGEFVVNRQRDAFHRYLLEVNRTGSSSGLVHVVDSAGCERLWEFRHRLHLGADGKSHVVCTAIDVSGHNRNETRMREATRRDSLTGCFNRRHLEAIQADAAVSANWACVVVDIDSLKRTNDTYGQAAGDQAILRLARFLERIAHTNDVVVRLGGDEFAILMMQHDRHSLEAYTSRLQGAQATQETTPFSFGIAVRKGDEDLEHTIQRADHQMIERRLIERISIRLDSPGLPRQSEVHQPVLHLQTPRSADVIDIKRVADQTKV